jgi:hypothetical protein
MLNLGESIRRLSNPFLHWADLGDERFLDQGSDDCTLPDALYNDAVDNGLAVFGVGRHKQLTVTDKQYAYISTHVPL